MVSQECSALFICHWPLSQLKCFLCLIMMIPSERQICQPLLRKCNGVLLLTNRDGRYRALSGSSCCTGLNRVNRFGKLRESMGYGMKRYYVLKAAHRGNKKWVYKVTCGFRRGDTQNAVFGCSALSLQWLHVRPCFWVFADGYRCSCQRSCQNFIFIKLP